jgi:hypothetical protein
MDSSLRAGMQRQNMEWKHPELSRNGNLEKKINVFRKHDAYKFFGFTRSNTGNLSGDAKTWNLK